MFQLKTYQEKTLEVLQQYLEEARFFGAEQAFEKIAIQPNKPYKPIETLENVPYICLRLPTGGGKTFLSAHSISVAAKSYLEQDYPVVLWLTPSTVIKEQTVETLKNINHPNRKILERAFGGNVCVYDITDFTNVRPQDLKSKTCVFVSTIQSFRVENTEGRKIYSHNENLEPHFSKVPDNHPYNLDRIENGGDSGKIKFSFANLLNLYRPLVIVDEAHNATSKLSYEVMNRVNPACIIEFTATPATNSNVLYRVSAMELKAEEMIKLPIILTEHQSWQESLNASILMRQKLAETALKDKDYIRPIVLIQAESKEKEVTVEVIKQYLIDNENIEPEKIAVATGEQRELDGINILDHNCKIEYVITMQALKEGWDCPFAYIFCSVATVNSKKDVEQLLGRVLRMPYAKSREESELNKAYAFVSASSWKNAVSTLCERLVEMGFDETEAESFIDLTPPQLSLNFPTSLPVKRTFIAKKINTSDFTEEEKQELEIEEKEDGSTVIKLGFDINEQLIEKIEKNIDKKEVQAFKQTVAVMKKQIIALSPSEKGEIIAVPQLSLFIDGEWEQADKEFFLPNGWHLLDYPAILTNGEFYIEDKGRSYEIDIDGKKITERFLQHSLALDLDNVETNWTNLDLSRWLDRKIYQPDITQPVKLQFLRRVVDYLTVQREISLTALIRTKFLLVKALENKINKYRVESFEKGFQQTLFGNLIPIETSFNFKFEFGKSYPAKNKYSGRKIFNKHFYPFIGEMNGEEIDCASAIDSLEEVKYWVRNIERYSETSFSLPTSKDRFYPDFVAILNDGRLFAIEYKGEHLVSGDDSREKDNIGKLWEEKSNGTCLFLMAVKLDNQGRNVYQQIKDKIKK